MPWRRADAGATVSAGLARPVVRGAGGRAPVRRAPPSIPSADWTYSEFLIERERLGELADAARRRHPRARGAADRRLAPAGGDRARRDHHPARARLAALGRAPVEGLLPRAGDRGEGAQPRAPAAPARAAAPRRLRRRAARAGRRRACSATTTVGRVTASALHYELGPIALAVVKRSADPAAELTRRDRRRRRARRGAGGHRADRRRRRGRRAAPPAPRRSPPLMAEPDGQRRGARSSGGSSAASGDSSTCGWRAGGSGTRCRRSCRSSRRSRPPTRSRTGGSGTRCRSSRSRSPSTRSASRATRGRSGSRRRCSASCSASPSAMRSRCWSARGCGSCSSCSPSSSSSAARSRRTPAFAVAAAVPSALVVHAAGARGRAVHLQLSTPSSAASSPCSSTALIPRDPRRIVARETRARCSRCSTRRSGRSSTRCGDADEAAGELALSRLRRTQPMIDAWSTSLDTAISIARISPWVRRFLPELRRNARVQTAADLTSRHLRTIARRVEFLVRDGVKRPALAGLVAELATGIRLLGQELDDPQLAGAARSLLTDLARRLDPAVVIPDAGMTDAALLLLFRPLLVDLLVGTGLRRRRRAGPAAPRLIRASCQTAALRHQNAVETGTRVSGGDGGAGEGELAEAPAGSAVAHRPAGGAQPLDGWRSSAGWARRPRARRASPTGGRGRAAGRGCARRERCGGSAPSAVARRRSTAARARRAGARS